jgi:hypothetical protein
MRNGMRLMAAMIMAGLMAAAVAGQGTGGTGAIDHSFAGTWKANLGLSKWEPGPGPKEWIRVYEDRGDGFWLVTDDITNAQGQKGWQAIVFKTDGKPYPWSRPNQTIASTTALTYVDAYTVNFTMYADGKPYATGTNTRNKDGKTMILEQKGTNPLGQPTSPYVVFEKQP